MSSDTNPLGLDLIDAVTGFAPAHDVDDPDKAETLAADTQAHGRPRAPPRRRRAGRHRRPRRRHRGAARRLRHRPVGALRGARRRAVGGAQGRRWRPARRGPRHLRPGPALMAGHVYTADGRRLYTLPQLAELLDIPHATLRTRRKRGQLAEPDVW